MINLDLEKHINQQIEQAIKSYLDSDELQVRIRERVDEASGKIIENIASRVYMEVIQESQITSHIKNIVTIEAQNQIHDQSLNLVRQELSNMPVKDIIAQKIQKEINTTFTTMQLPESSIDPSAINWKQGSLNGSLINGGMIRNFASTGIDDKSNSVQLTILDDHVVVENQFTAMNITAADTLTAKNLILTGTLEIGTDIVDHGPFSQLIQQHATMMTEQALMPYQSLLINGEAAIKDNTLHPSVMNSNLRKLGNLSELSVLGDAKLSDTMFVSASGKVGINTEEPRGALTIRDEEAEITFARTRRHTMFVGSTRDSEIEIGTNNQSQMIFKDNQIDISTAIRVMGIKFSVSSNVPEHDGEPNEIVMVNNAREGQPMFYICRGGNRWQSLR